MAASWAILPKVFVPLWSFISPVLWFLGGNFCFLFPFTLLCFCFKSQIWIVVYLMTFLIIMGIKILLKYSLKCWWSSYFQRLLCLLPKDRDKLALFGPAGHSLGFSLVLQPLVLDCWRDRRHNRRRFWDSWWVLRKMKRCWPMRN